MHPIEIEKLLIDTTFNYIKEIFNSIKLQLLEYIRNDNKLEKDFVLFPYIIYIQDNKLIIYSIHCLDNISRFEISLLDFEEKHPLQLLSEIYLVNIILEFLKNKQTYNIFEDEEENQLYIEESLEFKNIPFIIKMKGIYYIKTEDRFIGLYPEGIIEIENISELVDKISKEKDVIEFSKQLKSYLINILIKLERKLADLKYE